MPVLTSASKTFKKRARRRSVTFRTVFASSFNLLSGFKLLDERRAGLTLLTFPSRSYFLTKRRAGSMDERRLPIARSAPVEANFAGKKFPAGARFQTRTRDVAHTGSGNVGVAEGLTQVSFVSASPALNASP